MDQQQPKGVGAGTEYRPELDLDRMESQVIELCRRTAAFILEQEQRIGQKDVEVKGSHDYVTFVDKTSEKMLVEGLRNILPEAGFIAEEGTEKTEGERYNWIVDPLDGTTNFIHRIPFYCISIALQDKLARQSPVGTPAMPEGEIILGVVHHVSMEETFHAVWGREARLNGRKIAVSDMEELDNSLIVTGFPYYDFERLDGYMELLKETMRSTAGVRRLGSAALDLAAVAAGRSELFFEYGLRPWDVAAGQFIVKQAGGHVCDFAGSEHYLHGKEIVCGNPRILPKFLKMLQKYVPSKFLAVFALLLSFCFPAFADNPGFEANNSDADRLACDTDSFQVQNREERHRRSQKKVYRFLIDEEIGPAAARLTRKALAEARDLKADCIFLQLNTFGGTLKEADQIRTLLLQSRIPTCIYIDINAASAGALISIACDSIYMNPAATIGAATVVNGQGEVQPDKYQSYMRAMMRATAEATGRDPHIAEAMVDPSIKITGVSDSGKVLTFTAREALRYGYCQGIYPDTETALRALGMEEAEQHEQKLSAIDRFIHFLINPFVSGILIMMIVGGIYFELQSPGIGFPLAIALLGCLLYFAPHYIEGLASHWEILVFVVGLILLILEIFVIPGFGIAGVSGIFLICASLTLALVDNWGLHFGMVDPLHLLESFAIVVLSTLLALVLGYKASKRLFGKRFCGYALALDTEQKKEDGYVAVSGLDRYQALVGSEGIAESVMRPSGKIRIGRELYDATAESGFIEKGETVIVKRFENAQFFVRRKG